jgi:hypothetical protein
VVQTSAGRAATAVSSAPVIVHPTVYRTVRRLVLSAAMCVRRSWVAPAPSIRISSFARAPGGICPIASLSTRIWPVTVFDPALPGRSSIARDSRVLAHHAASG